MSKEDKKKNNIYALIIVGLIILVLVLFGVIIYLKFYSNVDNGKDGDNKNTNTVKVETNISDDDLNLMKKVSEAIFVDSSDKISVSEMDDLLKLDFVSKVTGKNLMDISGTEIKDTYKKYTGNDVELVGLPCGMEHKNGDSNLYLIYNSNTDKYEYNPDHPGHGGAGNKVRSHLNYSSSERKDNNYKYVMSLYFDDSGFSGGVGAPTITRANIFKTYNDALNNKNSILNALDNNELCTSNYDSTYDMDIVECNDTEIYKAVKNKIGTCTFEFELVDNNLVFKKYYVN